MWLAHAFQLVKIRRWQNQACALHSHAKTWLQVSVRADVCAFFFAVSESLDHGEEGREAAARAHQ